MLAKLLPISLIIQNAACYLVDIGKSCGLIHRNAPLAPASDRKINPIITHVVSKYLYLRGRYMPEVSIFYTAMSIYQPASPFSYLPICYDSQPCPQITKLGNSFPQRASAGTFSAPHLK